MSQICPNKQFKSSPDQKLSDWDLLVNKVGEIGAYKEFIKNGNSLPSLDQIESLEAKIEAVDYNLKSVNILVSDKAKQIFEKGKKAKWDLNKILTELQIPKEQKQLLLDLNVSDREELLVNLLANYSYSIEINIAKTTGKTEKDGYERSFRHNGNLYVNDTYTNEYWYEDDQGNKTFIDTQEYFYALDDSKGHSNSQYYSNLTVPGGTNYTENEISTPLITPSIKGHAQFSTDQGIGWFRSDEKVVNVKSTFNNSHPDDIPDYGEEYSITEKGGEVTKTRRILELQSDLFQKGREHKRLTGKRFENDLDNPLIDIKEFKEANFTDWDFGITVNSTPHIGVSTWGYDKVTQDDLWYYVRTGEDTFGKILHEDYKRLINDVTLPETNANQFLQLLNKDNNWVTFFVKSIIQDSAKKGYEKVLFPSGDTASLVEGHQTLADQLENKTREIKGLESSIENYNKLGDRSFTVRLIDNSNYAAYNKAIFATEEEAKNYISENKQEYEYTGNYLKIVPSNNKQLLDGFENRLKILKEEVSQLKTQGIEKLKPIFAFYETKVANILKKPGYNPIKVTDEYDNEWYEVTIKPDVKYEVDLLESVSQLKHNEYFLKEQNDIVDSLTQAALNIYEEARLSGESINEKEAIKQMFDSLPELAESYASDGDSEMVGRINRILGLLDETEMFIGFRQLVSNKIKGINFSMEEDPEYNDNMTSGEIYDQGNMERDPMSKMSPQVKRFFTFIPVIDENGNTESNYLGLEKFYDFRKIYVGVLSNVANLSPIDIEDRLVELVDNNLMYKSFYTKYLELTASEKNAVLSTLCKQTTDLKLFRFWPADNVGNVSGEVINSNQSVAEENIIDEWQSNFYDLIGKKVDGVPLFEEKTTEAGGKFYLVNPDAGKVLLDRYKRISASYNLAKTDEDKITVLTGLSQLFGEVGINISVDALNFMLRSGRFGLVKATDKQILQTELNYIFETLANRANLETRTEDNDINDIFNTTGENNNAQSNRLKALAYVENKFSVQKQTGAFTNGEGNTVYPFVERHFLNSVFNDIKQTSSTFVSTLLGDTFAKDSVWLEKLKDSDKFKDGFQLYYADATKNGKKKNRFGKKYEDLSDKEKILTRYIAFQNSGREQGLFVYPTPSDKTTFPLIGAVKLKLEFNDNIPTVDNINPESEAFKSLVRLIQSEVARVNKTIAEIKENKYKIKGYHTLEKTGKRFFMFPQLNEVFQDNIDKEQIIDVHNKFPEFIESQAKIYLQNRLDNELAKLKQEGIISNDMTKHMFDKSYYAKINVKTTQEKINYALLDYIINDTVALGNIYQLFTGDPAMLAKKKVKNKDTWQDIINQTNTNVFKRIAKDIAPGREGVFTSHTYNTIFINEPKSGSEIGKTIKSLYNQYVKNEKGENTLDAADAQEWVLVEEYVDTLFAYGEISQPRYDAIKQKLKDGIELTEEEIGIVLQPIKPVYTWRQKRSDVDPLIVTYYIKTSAFPLIPQLVKNTSLSHLYNFMKENNVQRAVVESGVKAGFSDPITVFEEDGLTVKHIDNLRTQLTENPNTIKTLSRRGFRIQQEVPYKAEKNEILLGTQFSKLIFANLNPNWEFNGKKGYELKQEVDALIGQMIQSKVDSFREEFKITPDGTIHDMENFIKAVQDMAVEKGFDYNDVFQLKTVDSNGRKRFEINPFFNTRYKEIESIFTSLVSNRIMKRKLPGRSYVQGSSVGFNTLKDQGIEKISTDTNVEGIVWTQPRKNGEPLDYRIDEDGGVYAEVLLPFHFFNDEGKLLKLLDYVKKDGTLDTKRFDTRLLEKIGYRIPTQGHMSMIKLKVVGFLPQSTGDLLIVPAAITKQMGSDFDVDKVYVHGFFTKMSGNKVVKNEEDIENKIIDIYKSILESKHTRGLITKTLSADPLNTAVTHIENLKAKDGSSNLGLLDRSYNDRQVTLNRDGKILIGISSLSSTHHALSQYANLYLADNPDFSPILFKNDEGTVYTDVETGNNVNNNTDYSKHAKYGSWRLDKIFGYESPVKSEDGINHTLPILDIIAYVQTAATDNAKDPILGRGNINKHTANVALLIARSGFDENWITNFTMQDVLVELSNRLNNELDDLTNMDFVADKKNAIITALKEAYRAKFIQVGGLAEEIVPYVFGYRELENLNTQTDKNKDYYLKQLQVLENFLAWDSTAQELGKLQNALNFETKGLGKDLYSVKSKLESIGKTDIVERKDPVFYNADKLVTNTTIGHLLTNGLEFTNTIYNNAGMFPYNGDTFNEIYSNIKVNSAYRNRDILSDDFAETINENVRFAVFNTIATELFKADRKDLMYNLGSRVLELKKELPQNLFLQKLSVVKPRNESDPVLIKYENASRTEEAESLNASIAWLDLYKDEATKPLAINLVKYAYTIGFERSMNDYGRFLPYDMMKELGIIDAINNVSIDTVFGNEVLNKFTTQFFQHNPESGIQFNKADVIADEKSKSFAIKESAFRNYGIETEEGWILPLVLTQYEKGENKKKSQVRVYYQNATNHYIRIDNLGATGINEYDLTLDFGYSALKANQIGTVKQTSNNVAPLIVLPDTKPKLVNEEDQILEGLLTPKTVNITEKLEKIATGTEYNQLADYLLSNFKTELEKVQYKTADLGAAVRGSFDPMTSTITISKNNPDNHSDKGFKETIIHETIHGLTSIKVNNYYSGNTLTPSETKAIKELEIAVKQLKVLYEKGVKVDPTLNEKLDKIFKKETAGQVKEIIAEAFANDDMKKWLNTVKSPNKNESFWDKFKRIISSILGIDVKSGTALADVISASLELMQKPITSTTEQQEIDTRDNLQSLRYKDKLDVYNRVVKSNMKGVVPFRLIGTTIAVVNNRQKEAYALLDKLNEPFNSVGKLFTIKSNSIANPTGTRNRFLELVVNEDVLKRYNDSLDNLFGADYLESTSLSKYERAIQDLTSQIRILEKNAAEGKTSYAEVKVKIKSLNELIDNIEAKYTDETLLKVAKAQLKSVKNNIERINMVISIQDPEPAVILKMMSDLQESFNVIEGWRDLDELMDFDKGSVNKKTWQTIKGDLDDLRKEYLDALGTAYARYNTVVLGRGESKEELFNATFDTGMLEKNFVDISVSDIALLRSVYEIIDRSKRDRDQEFIEKNKQIDNLIEKAEKLTGKKGLAATDIFLQKDAKGKWNGGFLQPFKKEYFDERTELLRAAKINGDKSSWAKYADFVEKNSITMTKEDYETRSNRFDEEDYEIQAYYLEKYENLRKAKEEKRDVTRDDINSHFADGDITEKERDARIKLVETEYNTWVADNSPYAYWDAKRKPLFNSFVRSRPTDKWRDPNYVKVKANAQLFEVYKGLKDLLYENNKMIPRKGQPLYYLPELSKTWVEKMKENGVLTVVGSASDWMKDLISEDIASTRESEIRIGSNVIKTIPVSGMSDRLALEQKSKDLKSILKSHTATALHYKHMSKIQPVVNASEQLLKEMAANQQVAEKKVINAFGKPVEIKSGLINAKEQLEYHVDVNLYKRTKEQEGITKTKTYSQDDKVKIKELDFLLESKQITQEEYNQRKDRLGKNITGSKIGDTVITLNYLQSLALAPVPAIVNGSFGVMTNFVHAAGKVDYDSKTATEALGIVMSSMSETVMSDKLKWQNAQKLYLWAERLGIFNDVTDGSFASKAGNIVMKMQSKSEFLAQGMSMCATLRYQKLKDKNGKEVSIWNAYKVKDNELVWDTEKMGEFVETRVNELFSEGRNGVNTYKLATRIQQMNKFLHGNYKDPIRFKKTILGRALMLFRTWIPYTYMERFGKEYYDDSLGRAKKGRWRSVGHITKQDGFKVILRILKGQLFMNNTQGIESQVDVENLRKFNAEIRTMLLLTGIFLMLTAALDDEDEEAREILTLALNSTNRLYSDMTFFINPKATNQILRNILPLTKTLTDILDFVGAIPGVFTGHDEYKSGPRKGRSKIVKEFNDVIPIVNQYDKIVSSTNYVYDKLK
jgi:hypothetical protein